VPTIGAQHRYRISEGDRDDTATQVGRCAYADVHAGHGNPPAGQLGE
jgi:hypothetical protein